jgi:hypothetical protein
MVRDYSVPYSLAHSQVCHSGPCGGCPEEGERRCPCGKAVYFDIKCDEKAALCGGTCGKVLDCGVHTCQERCHFGPCNKVTMGYADGWATVRGVERCSDCCWFLQFRVRKDRG